MAKQKFIHFTYQGQNLGKSVLEDIKKDFQSQKKEIINLTINKDGLIMAEDDKNFEIINGKKVPVYKAKVVETIKNKRTGQSL